MRLLVLLSLISLAVAVESGFHHTINYESYWSYDEIVEYMRDLERQFPNITQFLQLGVTAEGRDIFGIRIVDEVHLEQVEMPIMFVTAAASARDWISAMSAVNLIHMLVEQYSVYHEIVDDLEWFIVPVANPDGYEFSRLEGNRDWVKNRRPNNGSDCIGVNIERNFDFGWGVDIDSSADPCADNFRGPAADSEEETKTIQFVVDVTRRWQLGYVSIKAGLPGRFNAFISYPYAFSNEAAPTNWEEQREVARLMSDSVRMWTGARFNTGSFSNVANPAAATSMDYAVGVDWIPLPYTIFTPPGGEFGWDVEEWRINPIVDQVFFSIERLARYCLETTPPIEDKENVEN